MLKIVFLTRCYIHIYWFISPVRSKRVGPKYTFVQISIERLTIPDLLLNKICFIHQLFISYRQNSWSLQFGTSKCLKIVYFYSFFWAQICFKIMFLLSLLTKTYFFDFKSDIRLKKTDNALKDMKGFRLTFPKCLVHLSCKLNWAFLFTFCLASVFQFSHFQHLPKRPLGQFQRNSAEGNLRQRKFKVF